MKEFQATFDIEATQFAKGADVLHVSASIAFHACSSHGIEYSYDPWRLVKNKIPNVSLILLYGTVSFDPHLSLSIERLFSALCQAGLSLSNPSQVSDFLVNLSSNLSSNVPFTIIRAEVRLGKSEGTLRKVDSIAS